MSGVVDFDSGQLLLGLYSGSMGPRPGIVIKWASTGHSKICGNELNVVLLDLWHGLLGPMSEKKLQIFVKKSMEFLTAKVCH